MDINWFPGHMKKTLTDLAQLVKVIDFGIIIVDARIPRTSLNEQLLALFKTKPLLVLLNKCDLADNKKTQKTIISLRTQNIFVHCINAQDGTGVGQIITIVEKEILKEKIVTNQKRGLCMKPYKVIIIGIPNSGKSSLVNRLTKKNKAQVKNMPGTTKNVTWLRAGNDFLILDTPGLLWPKLLDSQKYNLAFTGAIPYRILVAEELVFMLINYLIKNYPEALKTYYHLVTVDDYLSIINTIAANSGMLLKGSTIDYHRVAIKILNDVNNGKLGGISFEEF